MALETLASLIAGGIPDPEHREDLANRTREAVMGLFGSRYRTDTKYASRIAFMAGNDAVSFAGLVHEDSPSSGVYGGMSLIWFPHGGGDDSTPASLLTFVCGTRGLSPDEQILGRPGHARHLQALRRHLHQTIGVRMWVKHDPTNLTEPFPRVMSDRFATHRQVFDRYGQYIYAAVEVPQDLERARTLVAACLDFYA